MALSSLGIASVGFDTVDANQIDSNGDFLYFDEECFIRQQQVGRFKIDNRAPVCKVSKCPAARRNNQESEGWVRPVLNLVRSQCEDCVPPLHCVTSLVYYRT